MTKTSSESACYILHGWAVDPQNEAKWQACRQELQAAGVATTFLPIPGLSTPSETPWDLPAYVTWLAAQLPKQPVTLIGHSFGGQLAIRFAALYPERVARLVLIDSAGLRDWRWHKRLKREIFARLANWTRPLVRTTLERYPRLRQGLYRVIGEHDYERAPTPMKITLQNVLADEVWADLPRVKAPTLVCWGADDQVTPLAQAHVMTDLIPQSQLVVLPQARHSPQFTHPQAVAAAVVGFVAQPLE